MGYVDNLKIMKAGDGEVDWSSNAGFPALIWFRNNDENGQLGWWLYWTDVNGEPQHMLIHGDVQDEAAAEERAREVLSIARPGS
ncbi:hypothetical protein ACIRJO_18005 [Streptomyces sp. NPDC102394]|uniref:hypothetical protein n=1 Tax=Streptomyces sp. NPDC102394 TaxID=3366167 RepID=UPI0037FD6FAF